MPKYFMSGEKDNTESIVTHLGTSILKSLPIRLRFVAYRCAIMCEKSFRCTSVHSAILLWFHIWTVCYFLGFSFEACWCPGPDLNLLALGCFWQQLTPHQLHKPPFVCSQRSLLGDLGGRSWWLLGENRPTPGVVVIWGRRSLSSVALREMTSTLMGIKERKPGIDTSALIGLQSQCRTKTHRDFLCLLRAEQSRRIGQWAWKEIQRPEHMYVEEEMAWACLSSTRDFPIDGIQIHGISPIQQHLYSMWCLKR